jgi:hypothetical protein
MFPTRHAIQRFQQRVAAVSTAAAFHQLQAAARTARARSTPRWWTPVKARARTRIPLPAIDAGCLHARPGWRHPDRVSAQPVPRLEAGRAAPEGTHRSSDDALSRPPAGAHFEEAA